jgi:uncharacterized membrane protein
MESRAKLLGHPVHQALIAFPLGALGFSVAGDALHTWSGKRSHAEAARLALDFGLASAALAAPFGLIDWLAIEPSTRAKRVGLWHGVGNAVLLGVFAASRLQRSPGRAPVSAKLLSGAGFLLSGLTAWLGGELVVRHGIGVSAVPDRSALGSLPRRIGGAEAPAPPRPAPRETSRVGATASEPNR